MSEELFQRRLLENCEKIGRWDFYNIGGTNLGALKKFSIIPNVDYKQFAKRKPDGLIVDKKRVIAVIESKIPSELDTVKKQNAVINDWLEVAQKLETKLLVVTDNIGKTIWVNALNGERVTDEAGNELVRGFAATPEVAKLIERILDSIDEYSSQIVPPRLKDPSPLAKQIWQDIWSVSGATPENCLYTFVELFIFKYLSDLNVLQGMYSFTDVMKRYETNSSEDVLEYYANVVRKRIKELFPANPKDNTTIINGTIFVSKDEKAVKGYSTVFKRVLERFEKEGKLENIHHDFKSRLFESFLKESISKKNWGQFFTPLKVVRAIVKMVEIKEGMAICDPACGVGKFLLEPVLQDLSRFYKIKDGKLSPQIKIVGFDKGFDKDEQKTIILAKANMLIYLSDQIKENSGLAGQFAELFNQTFLLETNSILGTLSEQIENEYDLILTNPPYVTSGSSNLKEEIRKSGLEQHYNTNSLGIEGLFVQWIIKALKPNGKAFVIIPDGILNRIPDKDLRQLLLDKCHIDALISLPSKTFFTTTKKTTILAVTKKNDPQDVQKDPVFTYLVSEIGETLDTYRFDLNQNHLEDAANLFNLFKGSKRFFKPDDPRCKTIDIDVLITNVDGSWIVGDQWSNEEKIALGVAEQSNSYSVQAFGDFVGDVANVLTDYQEPLKQLAITDSANTFREVSVLDESVFRLARGRRITKKTINAHKGDIPVYSSSQRSDSVLGHVSEKFLIDEGLILFTEPAVLINIDGSVGHCFVKRDEKFSFIDVVAALQPVSDDIDLDYLKCELQSRIRESGADYQTKLYLGKIKSRKMTVKIPVRSDGSFDLEAQQDLAKRYQAIEEIREELNKKLEEAVRIQVVFT